ncbi:methyl-accepting chemotaxis protein [Paenibacillus wulumuqiensis]|uniref:methyl-accepting chemotaxis protein n=1 Tax=Paenibacillus wulumuqiensis TaxID=1567107 RepID=UPI0009E5E169|nr:methyl-accepting chemotaxis protein [Paenibacillus wulumuqiensis]
MTRYRFKSIQARMMCTVMPIIFVVLLMISAISYEFAKQKLNEQINNSVSHSLSNVTDNITNQLSSHSLLVSSFAGTAGQLGTDITIDRYTDIVEKDVEQSDITYGMGIFFAADAYAPGVKYRSAYAYHDGQQIATTHEYDDPAYDYLNQAWYTGTVAAKQKMYYSEPYLDTKLNVSMITAGQAIHDANNKLLGVVTGDLDMSNIQNIVSQLNVGMGGTAVLTDHQGNILASGNPALKTGASMSTAAGSAFEQQLQGGDSGQVDFSLGGEEQHFLFQTIEQTGWKVGVILPEAEVQKPTNELLLLLSVISLIGMIIILSTLWMNNRSMVKEVRKIRQLSDYMAQGDYSHELTSDRQDEFGQMSNGFQRVLNSTSAVIGQLRQESNTVSETAGHLSDGMSQAASEAQQNVEQMEKVKHGAEVQLVAASESTTAMEEMAIGIQRVAESVQQVSEATQGIDHKTRQGNAKLAELNQQIHTAKGALDQAGMVVNSLDERSIQIGGIIDIIQEISGQTKLLALNASIEAARAGEHGKGFAVVASEISKLAENVSSSAGQITTQVSAMQIETRAALQGMQQGSMQVNEGLHVLEEIEARFIAISRDIERVADEVQEVSSASEQMSAGSEEVSASISQLADIARSSSSGATDALERSRQQLYSLEELNQSAQSLNQVSDALNSVVSQFKVQMSDQ